MKPPTPPETIREGVLKALAANAARRMPGYTGEEKPPVHANVALSHSSLVGHMTRPVMPPSAFDVNGDTKPVTNPYFCTKEECAPVLTALAAEINPPIVCLATGKTKKDQKESPRAYAITAAGLAALAPKTAGVDAGNIVMRAAARITAVGE